MPIIRRCADCIYFGKTHNGRSLEGLSFGSCKNSLGKTSLPDKEDACLLWTPKFKTRLDMLERKLKCQE